MSAQVAQKTKDFTNSIGVNTHLAYHDTAYDDPDRVQGAMNYLGIRHVRDGIPSTADFRSYTQLIGGGLSFDLAVPNGTAQQNADIGWDVANASKVAALGPTALDAIEGFNEPDFYPVSYGGQTSTNTGEPGFRPVAAGQTALYNAVHAAPALNGLPVYDQSYGYAAPFDVGLGLIAGHADYENIHSYAQNGEQSALSLAWNFGHQYPVAGDHPKVVTETGYYTLPNDESWWGGVDEHTQATETLNLLADTFKMGASKTYLYELLDEGTNNDPGSHFGLFYPDGSPKPAADAIHNLTSILTDDGGQPFSCGSLSYTLYGMPTNGHSMLLQKSSGAFDLVLWNEPKVWDPDNQYEITPKDHTVTISIDGDLTFNAKVFDPMVGDLAIQKQSDVHGIALNLTDHPLVVEMEPTGGYAGAASAVDLAQFNPAALASTHS